jgi:hypothetical protein
VCVCACLSALAKDGGVGCLSRCSDCWVAGGEGQKRAGRPVYMLGRGWDGNEKSTSWEAGLAFLRLGCPDWVRGAGCVAGTVSSLLGIPGEEEQRGRTAQDCRGSYARQVLCSKCKVGKG